MSNRQSTIQSQKLVISLIKEQIAIADQQQQLIEDHSCPTIEDSRLYVNTLTGLKICNDINLRNAQLKELYFYRIKMMRSELNDLSLKLEKFKDTLKIYSDKHNRNKQ
jgi:adenylate kinase family enzyme